MYVAESMTTDCRIFRPTLPKRHAISAIDSVTYVYTKIISPELSNINSNEPLQCNSNMYRSLQYNKDLDNISTLNKLMIYFICTLLYTVQESNTKLMRV